MPNVEEEKLQIVRSAVLTLTASDKILLNRTGHYFDQVQRVSGNEVHQTEVQQHHQQRARQWPDAQAPAAPKQPDHGQDGKPGDQRQLLGEQVG